MLNAQQILAAEWYLQPGLSLSTEYNDNPLLQIDPAEETNAVIAGVNLELGMRTPKAVLQLAPRFRSANYENNDQALDRDDSYLDFEAKYNTELSKFSMDLVYADESTRTSELLDTGLLRVRIPVERLNITPAWVYQLRDTDQINISFSAQEVQYEGGGQNNLFDYQYDQVSFAWQHQLSNGKSISASTYLADYEADDAGSASEIRGLQIGFAYEYSETLSFSAQVGRRDTEFTSNNFGFSQMSNEEGETLDISAQKSLLRSKISFSASRSIRPSSLGTLAQRDQLVGSYQYDIRPGFSFKADLRRVENLFLRNLVTVSEEDERKYEEFVVNFNVRLSRAWSVNSSFRANRQRFDDTDDANSNRVLISLRYNGSRQSISR